MASTAHSEMMQALSAHGAAIDALHQKLAAQAGIDKAKLQQAVDKLKSAHKTFHDDVLGCMG